MDLNFATSMFKKSIATLAPSVLAAMGAILVGTLLPPLATGSPNLLC